MSSDVKRALLIIDDEPEICEMLQILLSNNYNVTALTDPRTACEEIDTDKYDVILTDINMPHVSGIELLKHIREKNIKAPAIAFSGHADFKPEDQQALDKYADGYLKKPFSSIETLMDMIEKTKKKDN